VCIVGKVVSVTQLHDVVYMIFSESSTIITRFNATTHQRLKDIDVTDLKAPRDIVACEGTSRAYIADLKCVWRVSADGADIKRWLPTSVSDPFMPKTLSVTSTRLLVTSRYPGPLIQFDADGSELISLQLSSDVEPRHAAESPTGTFIISLDNYDVNKSPVNYERLEQRQIVEVDTGGKVLRQFSGSHLTSLGLTPHVAVDSHGNIFVADEDNRRILLLDDHLSLRRVIIDEHQLDYKEPRRLCYRERSKQLLVVLLNGGVMVFDRFDAQASNDLSAEWVYS